MIREDEILRYSVGLGNQILFKKSRINVKFVQSMDFRNSSW